MSVFEDVYICFFDDVHARDFFVIENKKVML